MTIQQVLNKYEASLGMDAATDLKKYLLETLKCLADNEGCQEERQTIAMHQRMFYRDLWREITEKATDDGHNIFILTVELRKILEKFRILENEKDGM